MISIKLESANTNDLLGREYGETMREAMARATTRGKRLRSQLSCNVMLRDCLGGLRAEIILRDGKPHVKKT